jgi:hypothetical protein
MSPTADVSQPSTIGWNPTPEVENVPENAENDKVRNGSPYWYDIYKVNL